MKTKLLLSALLLISSMCAAQDVKVKRGEIMLDNKAVAKVERNGRLYNISDMNNKLLFNAIITNETPLKNEGFKKWLQLTGNNGIVKEIELSEKVGFTLSNEKYLTDNLVLNNLQLFTGGLNEVKANAYFQIADRHISAQEDVAIETNKKLEKAEDSLAKMNSINIDKAGNIMLKGTKIGFLAKKTLVEDKIFGNECTYSILDLNKLVVANLTFYTGKRGVTERQKTIKTFDNRNFDIAVQQTSDDLSNDQLAKRFVYRVYANGYRLGDMGADFDKTQADKAKAQSALIADAKSKSLNIYLSKGYVIDANGDKKEGILSIEFESIEAKLNPNSNISDLTKYGSVVKLTDNGKDIFYKAKDGVKFCAGNRCFVGALGLEDGALGNDSGSQLSLLGESQFFEIIHENDGSYVLNHVKNPQYYYIKLKGNNRAIYLGNKGNFGTKSPEKIIKSFDKYMNCKALDGTKYNLQDRESLVQLLSDYKSKCGK